MPHAISHSVNAQRALLNDMLSEELRDPSRGIISHMHSAEALDAHLHVLFSSIKHCKYIYVTDVNGVQISSTVNRWGPDEEQRGRDRSTRPYMQHIYDESSDFKLSQAYISKNKKRPSVTAVQTIRDEQNQRVGYLGIDFDLRELPHSEVIYEEPSQWRQIKGDPAIRGSLFAQHRVESMMDKEIDDVLSVHRELMTSQGVHHCQIHFSSSRSTIWHIDDPYVYRILTMDILSDPDMVLAYPRRPYFHRAIVPPSAIGKVLNLFKALRFADETIYLRSGSLNVVNGKVGLNFSCDGSHYLNYDEFLAKGLDFWFSGEDDFPQNIAPALDLDFAKLEAIIEEIAGAGCIQVNKFLYTVENGDIPAAVRQCDENERNFIYSELKSVMDVYDGGVCSL
ncbi:MAG: PDC sensor domain-containing protein [Gammaproteobacteria bacterium]